MEGMGRREHKREREGALNKNDSEKGVDLDWKKRGGEEKKHVEDLN